MGALSGMFVGAALAVLGLMIIITIVGSNLGLTNVRGIAAGGGLVGFFLGLVRKRSP